jgi:hypothetical protein
VKAWSSTPKSSPRQPVEKRRAERLPVFVSGGMIPCRGTDAEHDAIKQIITEYEADAYTVTCISIGKTTKSPY